MANDNSERMVAICIGVALLTIREMTDDPRERVKIARSLGRNMATLVNDPLWGTKANGEQANG